jgi:hypothetical protein
MDIQLIWSSGRSSWKKCLRARAKSLKEEKRKEIELSKSLKDIKEKSRVSVVSAFLLLRKCPGETTRN